MATLLFLSGLLLGFSIDYVSSMSLCSNDTSTVNNTSIAEDSWVSCSLCGDPSHVPADPSAVFDAGAAIITCEYAHSLGYTLIPPTNCSFLQSWGESLCQCGPLRDPEQTNPCRLCRNGSPLPNRLQLGSPSWTCAELQVKAIRDDPSMCSVWQRTVGEYCGCDNHFAGEDDYVFTCRLCGGEQRLPNPMRFIFDKSCGELEFDANRQPGPDNCEQFQSRYGEDCCFVPPDPIDHQETSGANHNLRMTMCWEIVALITSLILISKMIG